MSQTIHVIGLGAGTLDQLPVGIYRFLTNVETEVFTRTTNILSLKSWNKRG